MVSAATAERVEPELSPLDEGVEEAKGTGPRPAEDTLRGGMVVTVSHWPTLASILGDIPGYFFGSVQWNKVVIANPLTASKFQNRPIASQF